MHFKKAKGLLSSSNGINLYRGCTHGCIHCDSRSKCYHMDYEFEDIEIKENAIELLESTIKRKRSKCMLSTGSMTDPYIPLENEIGNVRKALLLAHQYGFGFLINWNDDFSEKYAREIQCYCLVMSRDYIENHFSDIQRYANVIEQRMDDSACTKEIVMADNKHYLEQCEKYGCSYILVEDDYHIEVRL